MKRLMNLSRLSIIVLLGLCLFVPSAGAAEKSFTDYQKGEFGFDAVSYLLDEGIVQGYRDNHFRPNQEVNRGETAIMFQRAFDLKAPVNSPGFKDVPATSVYADAAAATKVAEIFKGGSNGLFLPYNHLTREQMASVLVRAFELKPVSGVKVTINDLDQIAAAHVDDVKVLYQNGVTKGKLNGVYDPKGGVTRAEFSVFMYRALMGPPVSHPDDDTETEVPGDDTSEPEQEDDTETEVPGDNKPEQEQDDDTETEVPGDNKPEPEPEERDQDEAKEEPTTLEVTNTVLKTTKGSIHAGVTESEENIQVTYDLTNEPDQGTIVEGSMSVNADSTLTLTTIPSPINLVVANGTKQELRQGENNLSFANKMEGVNLSMIRTFIGNFTVGATLEDKNGNKQNLSLTFKVE